MPIIVASPDLIRVFCGQSASMTKAERLVADRLRQAPRLVWEKKFLS
jgi:lambda repressor-like predicted transcriptional regulator